VDGVRNSAAMLNELIQWRDGMLYLSDDSFSSNDVEQLISFFMHQLSFLRQWYDDDILPVFWNFTSFPNLFAKLC